ncbi:complement factor B-like protease [Diretmus argenteus]
MGPHSDMIHFGLICPEKRPPEILRFVQVISGKRGGVRCDCTEKNMQIEGGHYTLTKNLEVGSMLIYHCPEMYYPYPAMSRLCKYSSKWKPLPKTYSPQICRMVECPDPNVLEYGNVFPLQEKYYVNNETSYECYSGYTLRGSSTRVCQSNGKWSGDTPICSRDVGDHCADPGIPAGTARTGQLFGIDDTVTYSCIHNLYLVGSAERKCQENGQWTGMEPECYYKHTYDTPLEVSEAFGGSIRQSLTVLQSTEDTQEGRSIKITKNGTLNIYIAMDISESIKKEEIGNATLAVKTLLTKKMAIIQQQTQAKFKDHRHVLIFFTDDIYVFAIGTEIYDEDLQSLTTGTGGKHYFKLKDINNLQKTFDEIIVKKVKKLHIHPDYNVKAKKDDGVTEFYDYDVALIELETYVNISVDVRPICIPCTQETSEALKLVGATTCKQQGDLP